MVKLKSWLSAERGRGAALAAVLRVPPSFVTKMGNGEKSIPIEHMAAIEAFTGGAVTRQDMYPSGWQRIWPELSTPDANSKQKPAPALDSQAVGAIAVQGV
jgi:DNA-binding transcriptional regulator YdaS (Cro superfamily)